MLASLLLSAVLAATPCGQLSSTPPSGITITAASVVAAGPYRTPPGPASGQFLLPAHCRVTAVLSPTSDSRIEVEVWLPFEDWNGRLQAVGNSGLAGTFNYGLMARALQDGYATASTDTGHKGDGARFAIGHPEQVVDFAYRAVHEMAVAAKAIIASFYGRAPSFSYWNGCSTGGRQGLMEAQRYPEDFDGIVAGAAVNNEIHLAASNAARHLEVVRDRTRFVPPEGVALLTKAVLEACDARDGAQDGIVSDPERCSFDPATLLCRAQQTTNCLTAPQVSAVNRAYNGVQSTTGESIYPGSARGFEAGLRMPQDDALLDLRFGTFRFFGRRDENWDANSFDLEVDLALAMSRSGYLEATDPDLSRFRQRGGKLLLYHGWADPGPSPLNTIQYHRAVGQTVPGKQEDWMRLFLMPGVGHCGGGPGPSQASFMAALERWRESGTAPDRLASWHVIDNRVDMTRPLCPYPLIARYSGKGSTRDEQNFECAVPRADQRPQ